VNVSCFSPPTRGSFIERWWYPLRVVSQGSHGSDLLSTAATTQMLHRFIRHPFMIKLWYLYHKCITHTKPTLSNQPDRPTEGLASEMMRQYTVAPDNRIGRAPLVGVAMLSDPDGTHPTHSIEPCAADCTRKILLTGADLTAWPSSGGDLALGM